MKVLQNSSEVSIGKFKSRGKDNINFTVSTLKIEEFLMNFVLDTFIYLYLFLVLEGQPGKSQ